MKKKVFIFIPMLTIILTMIFAALIISKANSTSTDPFEYSYVINEENLIVYITVTAKTEVKSLEISVNFISGQKSISTIHMLGNLQNNETVQQSFHMPYGTQKIKVKMESGIITDTDFQKNIQAQIDNTIYKTISVSFVILVIAIIALIRLISRQEGESKKSENRTAETREAYKNDISIETQAQLKENSCIMCGANAGNDRFCKSCRQKLESEGIKVEQNQKCVICGENSGSDKLCSNCKQKLADADLNIGHKDQAEHPQQIIINNETEEKSGCGSCCLYTLATLGVMFILLIIALLIAGKALLDMITTLPFLN